MMDLEQIEIGPHMQHSLMPVLMMVDVYWRIIHRRAEELVRILLGNPSDRSWRHGLKIACDWWNTWPMNRALAWIFFWSCFGHASTHPVLRMLYFLLIFGWDAGDVKHTASESYTFAAFQSGGKVMPRSGRRSTRHGPDSENSRVA